MRLALFALAVLGGFAGRPPADVHPVWSPDGTEIAYFRTGAGIRVVGADGTGDRPLPGLPATSDFAFSPDWSWVAVVVFRSPGPTTLELMRPDGSERRVLATDALSNAAPGFSPDGAQIAYAGAGGLRLVGVDGSGPTALAARPSWWPVDEGSAVSSDGRIARSAVGECGDRVGIYVEERRITNSCRVEGTDGPDRLHSSGALFQIVDGRGGDDVLIGVGAAPFGDVLLGGAGNDRLTGGSLPDRLTGRPRRRHAAGRPESRRAHRGPRRRPARRGRRQRPHPRARRRARRRRLRHQHRPDEQDTRARRRLRRRARPRLALRARVSLLPVGMSADRLAALR